MVSAFLFETSKTKHRDFSIEKCERKYIFNVDFWI